jgi:hypothetical protein
MHDIDRRVMAYLEGGAREVIVIGQRGQVEYWGAPGRRKASMFDVTIPIDPMYFDERGAAAKATEVRR